MILLSAVFFVGDIFYESVSSWKLISEVGDSVIASKSVKCAINFSRKFKRRSDIRGIIICKINLHIRYWDNSKIEYTLNVAN